MHAIILCGGSGTRLWPLSRKNYPKQFLKLYSDKSLLQETYLRMRKIASAEEIIFVTNKDNYFNVYNQIRELEENFDKRNILIEPSSLNTAPAIALAMKFLSEKKKANSKEPVVILPSDHYVGSVQEFIRTIELAARSVTDNIGTIGITPSKPETGYGYIKKGAKENGFYKVLEFKEKPDLETAKKYLASGQYLWNSGMYIFCERTFKNEIEKHAPEIFRIYAQAYENFLAAFKNLTPVSIDYALSEKSDKVVVFEGNFGWNDIGSFDSLAEIKIKDENPKHLNFDSHSVYVHTDSSRLVATLGVNHLNIVETADCLLVQKQGRAEDVKKIVEYLREKGLREYEHNLVVHRPWGKYEVLLEEPYVKVKRITVYPGQKLSLQSHQRRAEHWVVVQGTAVVTRDDAQLIVKTNESTYIPPLSRHRLANEGKEELKVIEVQTGDYLEEDDIVRYDDVYERS